MTATALVTAPFVADIRILIAPWARRSQDTLSKFVRNVPDETLLEFTTLRFMPFPKTRVVRFAGLRTTSESRWRLANLAYLPKSHEGRHVPWWLRAMMYQFYVRPGDRFTKASRAPGVWNTLMERVRMQSKEGRQQLPSERTTSSHLRASLRTPRWKQK